MLSILTYFNVQLSVEELTQEEPTQETPNEETTPMPEPEVETPVTPAEEPEVAPSVEKPVEEVPTVSEEGVASTVFLSMHNKTFNNEVVKNVSKSETGGRVKYSRVTKYQELPKTGSKENNFLTIVGVLLSAIGILYFKRGND